MRYGLVRTARTIAWALLAVLVALGLRLRAVDLLPIDYDEDDYMRAAQQYAVALQTGDASRLWGALTQQNYRAEHPQLMKLAFGLALSTLAPIDEIPDRDTGAAPLSIDPYLPLTHLLPVRRVAVAFATLEAAALAVFSPLAALLLALNTYHIKYTSQVMLEALPAFTATLCVLAYLRFVRGSRRRWLLLSAGMLGLTVAGKYLYVVAGVAVAVDAGWRAISEHADQRGRLKALGVMAAWGAIAIATFFAVQPYLWPDPLGRLGTSLQFHRQFATSDYVARSGLPPWQPLLYLSASLPGMGMAPERVYVVMLDGLISLAALFGVRATWRAARVVVLWFCIGLAFLLVWETKWPQYMLILTAPLSVLAAAGLRDELVPRARAWLRRAWAAPRPRIDWRQAGMDARRALPWLLPGAATLIVLTGFPLVYQVLMALTDVNARSLRDAMNGAVFSTALRGLTGALPLNIAFDISRGQMARATEVSYAGLRLLTQVFGGALNSLLFTSSLWMVVSTACQTALGGAVALLLNQPGVRFARAWRTLFVLPWAIPEFVGALAWRNIFQPDAGLVSYMLGRPFNWPDSLPLTLLVLLIAATWMGFPIIMLAATAALRLIPADAFEAAALDGATRSQMLRWITVPLTWPLLAPVVIIRAIAAFNQFYLFDSFQPDGIDTLAHISYLIFDPAGGAGGQFAVSAAINVLNVIVLVVLLVLFDRRTKAAQGVTYA